MSAITYRLPDWLGGHRVHIDHDYGNGEVRVWVRDHESTPIDIARNNLVEVRPPSIDDPEPYPLNLFIDEADARIFVEPREDALGRPATALGFNMREAHLSEPAGVMRYRRGYINLPPQAMRQIARALWQRANAVEGGERA